MVWVKYVGIILCLYGSIWIVLHTVMYRNGQSRDQTPVTREVRGRYTERHPDYVRSSVESASAADRPLLCLFTALIPNNTCGGPIRRLLLKNWISLSPRIRPYLFVDDRVDSDAECRQVVPPRWKTIPIPQYRERLPVFKDMLMSINADVDSVFVGYANADVLFDKSLLETLDYIRRSVHNIEKRTVLLVGRRRDYVIHDADVRKIAKSTSVPSTLPLAGPEQIDYVIFTRTQFKWEEIPDVVVGAPGFANILLALALEWNYIVLDVTTSLKAVRVTLAVPKPGAARDHDPDNDVNTRLLAREYPAPQEILKRGQIVCITYLTICRRWTRDLDKTKTGCNFRLAKRRKLPSMCQYQKGFKRNDNRKDTRKTPEPDEYDTFDAETILL